MTKAAKTKPSKKKARKKAGDKGASKKKAARKTSRKKAADKKAADKKAADKKAADKKATDKKAADKKAADKKAADREAADREAADREAADREAADRKAADEKAGDRILNRKMQVRWKQSTVDEYLARHGEDISAEHVFLPTKKPLEPGTQIRFELLLVDSSPFLSGLGTVSETRDGSSGLPGMVLRFDELSDEHREVVSRLREEVGAGQDELLVDDLDLDSYCEDDDTQPDALPAGYRAWKKKG